jgi:hypothetical protein
MRGRLMLPRRSPAMGGSRWHPKHLPGLSGLWLADEGLTVVGSKCSSITDQSGVTGSAVQATDSRRPVIVAGGAPSGKGVLRFAGTQLLVAPAALATFSEFTLFATWKRIDRLVDIRYLLGVGYVSGASLDNGKISLSHADERRVQVANHDGSGANAAQVDGAHSNGVWETWIVRRTGGTTSFFVNGSVQSLTNSALTSAVAAYVDAYTAVGAFSSSFVAGSGISGDVAAWGISREGILDGHAQSLSNWMQDRVGY